MPQVELASFLECTGNGRSRFEPVAEGTTWKNDAAGNAVWGGVRLRDLLEAAGVQDSGIDVVSQGGDLDTMQRGLPVECRDAADHAHRAAHEWRTAARRSWRSRPDCSCPAGQASPRPNG